MTVNDEKMILKYILTTIMLGGFATGYACKCGGPRSVRESYKNTDLIVYGKVISIDTVLLPETITKEDAKGVEENLRGNDRRLKYFKMTYVLEIGFEIIDRYKGDSYPGSIVIYTPMQSATCGYKFKKDQEYIVYASTSNSLAFLFQTKNETNKFLKYNAFWTTHCTRTAEYSKLEADELNQLKE